MKFLSRIVWSEGMHLSPHHFQAQSRYFEDSVHFARESLWCDAFGWVGYQLDAEALRNGTILVRQARGVFPDGLTFDMPECDALVSARAITELFPPTRDRLLVNLAVPQLRPGGQNCTLEGGSDGGARFIGSTQTVHDDNTGLDEKPVRVGRKNMRLLLETESAAEFITLPLACIVRDGSGHFVYDPDFIPPCLRLTASDALMNMLRRLIEILEEKTAVLSRHQQRAGKFQAGMSSGDVAAFWFLHTINASLGPLRHLYMAKRGHPEELFREMSRLAGALCTFGLDAHPSSLPTYDHLHLKECFQRLEEHIRRHLEIVIPTQAVSIPLKQVSRPWP
jgi:type VI secretion system protein ImpJ